MKTREFEAWVTEKVAKSITSCDVGELECYTERTGYFNTKIKLTIELPEKKIELTESQFNEACYVCADDTKRIKQKLFGDTK